MRPKDVNWDFEYLLGKYIALIFSSTRRLKPRIKGAKTQAKDAYKEMTESPAWKTPLSWSDPNFSLMSYDILILPGGHDKGVKQIIESEAIRPHLRAFFPLTQGAENKKICAAIWFVP